MRHLKLLVMLFLTVGFLFGCSKVTKLFDETKKETKTTGTGGSDESGGEPSANDVDFLQ